MTIAPGAATAIGPTKRVAALSAAVALGLLLGCAGARALVGTSGLAAPVAAAAACWIGGLAAVVAEERLGSPQRRAAAMVAGTGLRLGPPVVLALASRLQAGRLWEAGLAYYLGAFYIVVLVTDAITRLPLRQAKPRHPAPP